MTSAAGTLLEERRTHRRTVIRKAVMYTPMAVLALTLLGISITSAIGGSYGALIPAFMLAIVGLALTYESTQALRDLFATPVTTTGIIRRAWSKRAFIFLRSHYVLVAKSVFDISVVTYSQVVEGDTIEVVHWPHSKGVISVTKVAAEASPRSVLNNPSSADTPESTGSIVDMRDDERQKLRDSWRRRS